VRDFVRRSGFKLRRFAPGTPDAAQSKAMNEFDYGLLVFLNQLGDSYPILTKIVIGIQSQSLQKVLALALLWWAWFDNEGSIRQHEARERIAAFLVASVGCIAAVRLLAATLPFRLRPLANPYVDLHFPIEVGDWGNWSAFPSDHAVLFSMLATCLFFISRPLGLIAAVDAALLICFPRVFLGIHHPSDIIVGALIGIGAGWFIGREKIRVPLSLPAFALMRWNPSAFYAGAFVITLLFTQVFAPVTYLAIETAKFIRTLASL
jgi:membrane-associated phospholipid phosphatase